MVQGKGVGVGVLESRVSPIVSGSIYYDQNTSYHYSFIYGLNAIPLRVAQRLLEHFQPEEGLHTLDQYLEHSEVVGSRIDSE